MTKPSQAQVREINRKLLQSVRADWRFPDPRTKNEVTLEPLEYRAWEYSTSDDDDDDDGLEGEDSSSGSDSDGDSSDSDDNDEEESRASWMSPETEAENPVDESGAGLVGKGKGKKKRRKFSCPDDVAKYLDGKIMQSRKRRKLRALGEEMSWNQGLCFFLRRRNEWTGAITEGEMKAREAAKTARTAHTDSVMSTKDAQEKESKQQRREEAMETSDADSGIVVSPLPLSPQSPFSPPSCPSLLVHVYIPISIPFLPPTHSVRASIMARSNIELYEKIVRDSRTPAVPLNLAHMMRIIVQGWKDEGNWPPKSTLSEQQQQQAMMSAVAKKIGAKKGKATTVGGRLAEQKGNGLFVGHKHLQRGVESVKRALRLSGSAPPVGD